MSYNCDICGKRYSNKRNVSRHMKENHDDGLLHFKCVIADFKARFIRRSYLTKHLSKFHKMDRKDAKVKAASVILQDSSSPKENKLSEICLYEDISDHEQSLENVSDGEFESWLEDFSGRQESDKTKESPVNSENTSADDFQSLWSDICSDSTQEQTKSDTIEEENQCKPDEVKTDFFNISLKTTTTLRNNEVISIQRVASVGYSPAFDPNKQDPLEVISKIQQEFAAYIEDYGH